MRVAGIDPGATGACAFLDLDDQTGAPLALEIIDLPTLKVGGRSVIDAYALAREIDVRLDPARFARLDGAVLEQGGARPENGRVGAATFWLGLGTIRGVLAAHFIPIEIVSPAAWKRAMRVTKDKDGARLIASSIFPRWADQWSRVKDHGRAEAALIALHGAPRFQRGFRSGVSGDDGVEGVSGGLGAQA